VILAWIFDKERLMPVQYLGIAITLSGVVAITAG
jgi:drug/metabolite transporter (DMT)-like permease